MIKIIYLFSYKYLKKEKQSQTLFKETILQNNAYFVSHIFWWKKSNFFNIKNKTIKYTSCREISQH